MFIRNLSLYLPFILLALSCSKESINVAKGREIADDKLQELKGSGYLPFAHVDVYDLSEPILEIQEETLLVEYKDVAQNIWIIVTVQPDGTAEVSHMKIENQRGED